MPDSSCIFIGKPPECSVCLEARKLSCLVNHQHLKVSDQGKADLRNLLEAIMSDPERYKTRSGQEQRKGGTQW